MNFQQEIISWYNHHKRALPWRNTTDAYVIWLSEIILQQTRVEQGLPYFNRFLANYPTVVDFANASEDEILKLWQGLGYYSRGRNMLYTAKQVVELHNGVFPIAYETLIKLKGIGDYTAAAIASFSNNENKAVLDGNVFRVLSRYFGIADAINSTTGKKKFENLAKELIANQKASLYNQAIMEFGALQCKPKSPLCGACPIQLGCYAFQKNKVNELPVKLKKVKVRERFFNYFLAMNDGKILINKRGAADIWQNMYDLPLIEANSKDWTNDLEFVLAYQKLFGKNAKIQPITSRKHILTHQIIYVQFFALDNYIINFNLHTEIKSVLIEDFESLPQPKVISDFFEKYVLN